MKREQRTLNLLIAVVAVLATLVVVDLTGRRPLQAQDSSSAAFLTVVAGQNYRNTHMPIVVVDAQAMSILTYRYDLSGDNRLALTNARSFKYDRKMMDYNYHRSTPAHNAPRRTSQQGHSVEDLMKASLRQKPYN